MAKELLFSITKKDLVIEYFSGTGCGGQHRNKHQNCARVKHPPSGAVGICQEQRSKDQNTKIAFRRMVDSKKFQDWLKLETARRTGELAEIERKIERDIDKVRIEVKDEEGVGLKF
jgi:protein subunit release factor A